MKKIGFDNEKYLDLQSHYIEERINKFNGKLYLELGGKLFDDFHASRVLPGFEPDSKIKMLMHLKDCLEIVITINAGDIERNKIRGDLGISYETDVIRLIDAFRDLGLLVSSVVLTCYSGQYAADMFKKKLTNLGVKVYLHYPIVGYPNNIPFIVSEDGYGRNEYIATTKPLVIVTAPGPGSGKLATCLSQLYHENKRGIKAGYAKFETFPIWNLPLKHPVNLAYEAATADLNDLNMIDPFHLEAYGKMTVNYNRDVEAFPLLKKMLESILGESPYNSPTDMGVNMAGNCIIDDEAVCEAAKAEIVRRYFKVKCDKVMGDLGESAVIKAESIMQQAGVSVNDREVVRRAKEKAATANAHAVAIELDDGTIVTGKTSELLGSVAAAMLNAMKVMAGIDDSVHLIAQTFIEPIVKLKRETFGSLTSHLNSNEMLIALSSSAVVNPQANKALETIARLRGMELHSSVMLCNADEKVLKKLGVNYTCEPVRRTKSLY
ncbi:MAG: DUF1846 domain-containing protein [Clostridia bacterium]|nr:DUF1846 domain-containing protein [Clostridia bacterium]